MIWNTAWDAIRINRPGNFSLAFNNTAYNTGNLSTAGHFNLFGSRFYNNIMVGATTIPSDASLSWGNNLVSGADPGLADPANGDFRLASGSIAIDTGKLIPGITDGYGGFAPDIGAYELGAGDFAVGHDFVSPPSIPAFTFTSNPFNNLLQNGGFQAKDLSDWSQAAYGTAGVISASSWNNVNATVRSQNYGAKLKPYDRIEQVITGLTPNTTYTVSAWMKLADPDGVLWLGAKDYGAAAVETSTDSTSWAQMTFDITTGPMNTSATVYIKNTSNSDSGVYPLAVVPLPDQGAWYDADVTAYVQDEFAGDETASFLLTGGTLSRTMQIPDRASSASPYLAVTTASSGVINLTPTEDAYVYDGTESGTAHNSNPLWVRTGSAGTNRQAYLKFDLSGITDTITGVQLKVYMNYRDSGASLVVNSMPNDSWTETALTWDNSPTAALLPNIDGYVDDVSLSLPIVYNTVQDNLGTAILEANATLSSANGLIPSALVNAYSDAIDDATDVLTDSGSTSTELNSALADLLSRTSVFEVRNTLGSAIQTVQAFKDSQTESGALYAYPLGSKAELQAGINDATAELADANASVGDLNDAKLELDIDFAAFKNSRNKPGVFTLPYVDMGEVLSDTSVDFTYQPSGSPATVQSGYLAFSADVSRYTAEEIDDGVFKFDVKYDFAQANAYPGFLLRSQSATGGFSAGGTYFIIFKPTTWELQKYQNNAMTLFVEFPNTLMTEPNETYTLTIGSVNTTAGVRLLVYVDGVAAIDIFDNDNPITDEGYFAVVSSGAFTSDIHVKAPASGDVTDLEDLVDDAQTLHDSTTEGTGSGQSAVGAKAVFAAEIDSANEVLSAPAYAVTQADADAAVAALEDAIDAFMVSIND